MVTALYILADTVLIGRSMGAQGLAALDLALPVYNLFISLGILFGLGSATAYTVSGGKKQGVVWQALAWGSCLSILCLAADRFFLDHIIRFLGARGDLVPFTKNYVGILFKFSPFFIFATLLAPLVSSDGAPHLTMWGLVVGSITNFALDLWFIYGLGWGMVGAALATGVAAALNCLILVGYCLTKACGLPFKFAKFSWVETGAIMLNGFPSFIVEVAAGWAFLLFNRELLKLSGEQGVAAYGVIANIALVCGAIFTGIGQAIQPIISVNYGIGKWRRVVKIRNASLLTAVLAGFVLFVIGQVLAKKIVLVFIPADPKLLAITVQGLHLYSWALLPMGFNVALVAYFQAMEFIDHALIITLSRSALLVLLGLLLLPTTHGLKGIWLILPMAETVTLFLSLLLAFV